jgi:hypothetical protein
MIPLHARESFQTGSSSSFEADYCLHPEYASMCGAADIRNIREAFAAVGRMLQDSGGVFAFPSPVGKPFIIAGDEAILKDVLIHHASLYGKQHANGILEIFRKTTLPNRYVCMLA